VCLVAVSPIQPLVLRGHVYANRGISEMEYINKLHKLNYQHKIVLLSARQKVINLKSLIL